MLPQEFKGILAPPKHSVEKWTYVGKHQRKSQAEEMKLARMSFLS